MWNLSLLESALVLYLFHDPEQQQVHPEASGGQISFSLRSLRPFLLTVVTFLYRTLSEAFRQLPPYLNLGSR